ncbi:MAG: hypothetical protein ACREQ5_05085 [Candidatus Dormibacteria bacterium]
MGTVDSRLLNGYLEKIGADVYAYKRPGYSSITALSGNGLGLKNWQGDIYSIFGTTLYKNGISVGTVNGSSPYTFNSNLGTTNHLFLKNLTHAYQYDTGGGLVAIAGGYPAVTIPGSAFLDGTVYVMQANAAILGSDINDLTTWGALNTIIAQMEPDSGVFISKQIAYVVAMKQWTTEVFFDAGNPTGSPLQSAQGAQVTYGCRAAGSVQTVEGALAWISSTRTGSIGVVWMEGVKAELVSTAPIERLLQQADFTTVWSWNMKIAGHIFYGVTLKNSNLTLVYDRTTNTWFRWTDTNGNYWPFVDSTYDSLQQVLIQHETNGNIYKVEATTFLDAGQSIPFDLYTPNFDGGNHLKKTLVRMDFLADQASTGTLSVRVSDDDYQTWTNFRTVDLGTKRPNLRDCGTFRKRAFHFHYTSNTPLRLKSVDMNIIQGVG